jgi:oxygen-independent coproporphyrinogen-3 oxidase
VGGREELSAEDLAFETLFLGLRMKQGVDLDAYKRDFGIDLMREKGAPLAELEQAGLVTIEGGTVRPTRAGMAVADALAVRWG